MTVTLKFLWYDFWVGAFYDRQKRILYVCPLPCVVFIFTLKKKDEPVEMQVIDEYTEGVEVTDEMLKRIADRSGLPYPYLTLGLYDLKSKPINPSSLEGARFTWEGEDTNELMDK